MNRWEIQEADLPNRMSFDELIAHPLYHNYVERYGGWRIILSNGVFYRMDREDNDFGWKCRPDELLDRVGL